MESVNAEGLRAVAEMLMEVGDRKKRGASVEEIKDVPTCLMVLREENKALRAEIDALHQQVLNAEMREHVNGLIERLDTQ